MQYPFRLASINNMAPIHALPVELLTRIFQIGVDSEPIPDDRDHSALSFEVSISHVCRHWRQVSLHTPLLWTTVHFRTKAHMLRGNVYLARNARLPIDIYVDTCSEDANTHRKDLLFREEFIPVFNIVLPHIDRWRELHLKVADLDCKLSARRVLSTCGSAPALRTLQLWHVQNWQTPERLFTAIGPPPVVVFAGELPSLQHIVLQGVNLPWMSSPFLRNLTSIEYALHSDDVRMPFHLRRKMLASSPNLERLSLHYSGPRARTSGAPTPDGIEWWGADPPGPDDAQAHGPGYQAPPAVDPVYLPRLQEIKLIDLESDYLVAVFKSIDAPNVRHLTLEDASSPGREDRLDAEPLLRACAVSSVRCGESPFPRVEALSLQRVDASAEAFEMLFKALPGLRALSVSQMFLLGASALRLEVCITFEPSVLPPSDLVVATLDSDGELVASKLALPREGLVGAKPTPVVLESVPRMLW